MDCFDALQHAPRILKRAIAFGEPHPFLHDSVILLDHIIRVLALTQANATRQRTLGFQCLDGCWIGGVLVNVQDPWHGIARCFDGFNQEAFCCRRIAFRGQQKLDRLARGVDRTVKIPVLALDP
jgi:hypothetical protein